MADNCQAWLLNFNEDYQAASAHYELEDVYVDARLIDFPKIPKHCKMMHWRQRIIPVLDFGQMLDAQNKPLKRPVVAIFGFQENEGERVQYGGLLLQYRPEEITVRDADACSLALTENGSQQWENYALSCFKHLNQPTPILDFTKVFG